MQCEAIQHFIFSHAVQNALMKSNCFGLPKCCITTADEDFSWLIMGVAEYLIERLKKSELV